MTARSATYIRNIIRRCSTNPCNNEVNSYYCNRNPRNLERLRLDRKPTGYPLDKVHVEFWHKLEVKELKHHVVARLIHNTNKVVVEASTNEWGICKQLPSQKDKMAFITLARVFAERCQETGIYSFYCDIPSKKEGEKLTKHQLFLQVLLEENLMCQELPQFDINKIWHTKREKRPWTVLED